MAARLKTTIVAGIAVAAVLALLLQWFIVHRVLYTRDAQFAVTEEYREALKVSQHLTVGKSAAISGQVPQLTWFEGLDSLPLLQSCCVAQTAAVKAIATSSSQRAPSLLLRAVTSLESAVARYLTERDRQLSEMIERNALLPWLSVGVLLLVLAVAWMILRRGVLVPVDMLMAAVKRSQNGEPFQIKGTAPLPGEVAELSAAFAHALGELRKQVAEREYDLLSVRESARQEGSRMAEELAELIDGSSSPIMVLDETGAVRTWNRRMAALTGVPVQVAMGTPFESRFLSSAQRLAFHEAFMDALAGQAEEGVRITVLGELGPFELMLSVSPRRAYDGHISGVTVFGHVMGEFLEETARQVEHQRSRQFSELAAGAAHQLNQPLQKMRLYLANAMNRLKLDDLDKEKLEAKLLGVDEQLERLSEIIEHLRLYGRHHNPLPGGFSLSMVLSRCVELNRGLITEQGIRLQFDNELNQERVAGHPLQVERALIALFDNAREAIADVGPEQPSIHVGLSLDGEKHAVIRVVDNGGGVDADIQSRVFDPFFTTRTNSRNVGLGLSSARALVEDLGGELTLTSRGEGTELTIRVPLMSEEDMEGLV